MTLLVVLEGFERESGGLVTALTCRRRLLDGYPLSRRPRELKVSEVDAIIDRFAAFRLRGLRYTIRLAVYPTPKVGEHFYEVAGFVPAADGAFFTYTDYEHRLTFDLIRRALRWRRGEEEFANGISLLKPAAAKTVLSQLGFVQVADARYDIGVVTHYPQLGPVKYFRIEERPRGSKRFRYMDQQHLSLRQVDKVLGTRRRGRRGFVSITLEQLNALFPPSEGSEGRRPSSEYRISRVRGEEQISW